MEEGLITAVECFCSLKYDGRELIGIPLRETLRRLGRLAKPSGTWDDGTSMVEVDDLGLTLWVEDGIVESATVEDGDALEGP